MAFDYAFVTKVFASLFAIMNPIANIPVFLSLTEGAPIDVQKRVAVLAAACTGFGCLVTVVAGRAILDVFGIGVDDFRLAGGLLVLLIALSMLHGVDSPTHAVASRARRATPDPSSVAIYPLTIPLLVGPGTIAALVVFADAARARGRWVELAVGLCAFLLLVTAALTAAPTIGRHLSASATAVTRRLMGMILAAVAMEMIVDALRALFPVLAQAR